jgi:ABC-type uncharacterized transport system substrate-binding protein
LEPIVFHAHYWRVQPKELLKHEVNKIIDTVVKSKPDLIVVFDDEAADSLMEHLIELKIPLLFNGINQPKNQIRWLTKNNIKFLAGILEVQKFEEAIKVLRILLPKAQKIAILSSKSRSSEIIAPQYREGVIEINKQLNPSVQLVEFNMFRQWEEWKAAILKLNTLVDAICIVVPYDVRDTNNIEVPVSIMGNWLVKNTTIPTFGNTSSHTKMGMTFSIALPPESLGRQSAEQQDFLKASHFQP